MPAWIRKLSPKVVCTAAWLWLKSAAAGVVLIPAGYWVAGAIASVVIAGVAAIVGVVEHGSADAGGDSTASRGGEIEMTTLPKPGGVRPGMLNPADADRGLDQSDQPGRTRPVEDPSKRKQRPPGQVELLFNGNVDLRHLRYRLVYHPADPNDAEDAVYLHHARRNPAMVSFVSVQEIEAHPMRYPWHHTNPRRLCTFGVRLSRDEPSCEGVLRIAPQRNDKRSALTTVRVTVTAEPGLGVPGEDDAVEALPTTLTATRQLKLREVFFVTMQTLAEAGEVLLMVERDLHDPALLTALPIAPYDGFTTATIPMQTDNVELARDGSRLYLSNVSALYEWKGEDRLPPPITELEGGAGGIIAGMRVIDAGVCLVRATPQASPRVSCLRQDSQVWTHPAPVTGFEPPYGVRYAMASIGNSLVFIPDSFDSSGRISVGYMPDASLALAQSRVFPLAERGGSPNRWIRGVKALSRDSGQDLYLLYGSFPTNQGAYSVLSLHSVPGPRLAFASLATPFGRPPPVGQRLFGRAEAWPGPGQSGLRVFGDTGELTSEYYSLLRRKPLAVRELPTWDRWVNNGVLRLLERGNGAKVLVAGGWLTSGPTVNPALAMYHVPGYLEEPELREVLQLPYPTASHMPLHRRYAVSHITTDASLLWPVPRGQEQW